MFRSTFRARWVRLAAGALWLLLAAPALAAGPGAPAPAAALTPAAPPADDPYVVAARATGVPLGLLVAVAGAESAFHPYALNIKGHQIYCHSRLEAEQILATTDNVDIGLMQINYPFWGHRLGVSKYDLLDPRVNLLYGARILKQPLTRRADFWHGVSDYHSGTPQTRDRYNQRVYAVYLDYLRGRIR